MTIIFPIYATQLSLNLIPGPEWEQDISITVGPSKEYDPSEPLCLPHMAELDRRSGLLDYICQGPKKGKFVKISHTAEKKRLSLCEVKVFVKRKGEKIFTIKLPLVGPHEMHNYAVCVFMCCKTVMFN